MKLSKLSKLSIRIIFFYLLCFCFVKAFVDDPIRERNLRTRNSELLEELQELKTHAVNSGFARYEVEGGTNG